jgi:hypothetical protein
MGGRRRSRRRGDGGGKTWWIVGVLFLVVIGAFGVGLDTGSVAFTSASSERGSSVDVADDESGLFGLDVAADVEAGTTTRLVTVTNRVGQTVDVTVSLDGATGTLSNGRGQLQPGASRDVLVDVPCGNELESVSFTVSASADSRFSASATRFTNVDSSACGTTGREVAFVDSEADSLKTVAANGPVTTYDVTGPKVVGQPTTDLDGDGDADVPYVDGNDNLRFIDSDNNTRRLDGSGEVGTAPLGVGDYDDSGTPEVYYVRDGKLFRSESGAGPTEVVSNRKWDVSGVAGVADFDSDGALEVVFTIDRANRIAYLDETGSLVGVTGKAGKVDTLAAISTPRDFDGDGAPEVAAYNSDSKGIDLYDASGADGSFGLPYQAAETPMAALDYDGDGVPEVVHLDSGGTLRALDATDGTTTRVTDSTGGILSGSKGPGVG